MREGVSILFCIGGDGTLRGASAIAAEALRRGRRLAVVGVPKTIDNDVDWVERSFGFATAVRRPPGPSSLPTPKRAAPGTASVSSS